MVVGHGSGARANEYVRHAGSKFRVGVSRSLTDVVVVKVAHNQHRP